MKKMLKWSLCILFIICFVNTCVYHRITHMSDDELEWIANRYEGEMMLFKSQYADIDTLTVLEVCICNNLNPINWGHYNTSNKELKFRIWNSSRLSILSKCSQSLVILNNLDG